MIARRAGGDARNALNILELATQTAEAEGGGGAIIPEQVEEGVTGHLVPPGDPAALAQAIEGLLSDPVRRGGFATAARERAVARFDARRMVDDYVDWYERLSSSIDDSSRIRSA